MNKFEQPESSAAPRNEKGGWKKGLKKKVITGALLGASLLGGGVAVRELNKGDVGEIERQTERTEVKKLSGIVSEKITMPPHVQAMPTMLGKSIGVMPVQISGVYSLRVSVEGRDQFVSVAKNVFDSVSVGENVSVVEEGDNIGIEERQ